LLDPQGAASFKVTRFTPPAKSTTVGQVAGPTLLRERSENSQVWLAVIVPLVFGAIVGIFLGTSATVYWILLAVAALGALLSGLEHDQVKEAAGRGAVAGAMFGLGILAAHQLAGTDAKVSLGSFPAALIVIDAIAGALLAALGCRLARRRRPKPSIAADAQG
jgi:4-amino-4-deoxy-L-arabinose transferase-like glycosyltransferase